VEWVVIQELDDVSDQERFVPDRFDRFERLVAVRAEHFAIDVRPQRLEEEEQVSCLQIRGVFLERLRPVQPEEDGVWRTDSGEVRWRRLPELVPV